MGVINGFIHMNAVAWRTLSADIFQRRGLLYVFADPTIPPILHTCHKSDIGVISEIVYR